MRKRRSADHLEQMLREIDRHLTGADRLRCLPQAGINTSSLYRWRQPLPAQPEGVPDRPV